MCEFCVKHGEGQKWYLAMKNYSRELLTEDRLEYMADFANSLEDRFPPSWKRLDAVMHTPLKSAARRYLTRVQKRDHYGQVVPVEDVEQILSRMDGIARLPCVCRRITTGKQDARYCFALTSHPRLAEVLDDSFSLEYLAPREAIQLVRSMDQEGLVHTVWTFKTPFIGALCNCDKDCIAYRICHVRNYYPVMFRGESVASVDPEECNGCRVCMMQCQFGAIRFSAAQEKVEIDPRQCYGCGVCRASCNRMAITLKPRSEDPVAATIW